MNKLGIWSIDRDVVFGIGLVRIRKDIVRVPGLRSLRMKNVSSC